MNTLINEVNRVSDMNIMKKKVKPVQKERYTFYNHLGKAVFTYESCLETKNSVDGKTPHIEKTYENVEFLEDMDGEERIFRPVDLKNGLIGWEKTNHYQNFIIYKKKRFTITSTVFISRLNYVAFKMIVFDTINPFEIHIRL